MATLVNCKECGAEISKNAIVCPHCGEPAFKKTSLVAWMLLIMLILWLFVANRTPTQDVPQAEDPKIHTMKELTQTEIKQKEEAKNKDIVYCEQSKESIIEDINHKIQDRKYDDALMITAKYLSHKGKDGDIIKINNEIRVLADNEKKIKDAKVKKDQQDKNKKDKHKKEIIEQLKTISSSDYAKNQQLYKTLLSYEPTNKTYEAKVKFYTDKINRQEKDRLAKINKQNKDKADRLATFGVPPTQSAWDGTYYAVKGYLEKVTRDPDSVKVVSCTDEVMENENGWLVRCTWRGRNGFGEMFIQDNWFTIRHDIVVRMDEASAYTY